MEALGAVGIAPQAASVQLRTLLHLVPEQRVREWAAQCAASHQHLSDKVTGLFGSQGATFIVR